MWDIFKSILNKFTKQFMPMKKIRNNKKVKPKWMNWEIKRLRKTIVVYQIKKQIHQKKISRDIGSFCKARK